MFTLEIGGKPIAVTDAEADEARELFESEPFKADLRRLLSDGTPLWDGSAALTVRAASEEEVAEFEDSEDEEDEFEDDEDAADAEADAEDEDDEDEDEDAAVVMFLVPITDPDEED